MGEIKKKVLVVAHGDLDGVVSAALIFSKFGLQLEATKIEFTQPYLVDRVEVDKEIQRLFVVDIAVNNRDPEMTREFVEKVREKLVMWADHHKGWSAQEWAKERSGFTLSIREEARCTAEILDILLGEIPGYSELLSDAIAADTRQGELSENGRLIDEAIKADLGDNFVRQSAVEWIVNGCKENGNFKKLKEAQRKYQKVQETTKKLVKEYKIHHGVAVVDVRDVAEDYDRTQLLLKGEQIAPTKTAVLLGISPEGEEIITVATMDQKKNLVNLFGLPSGAPFRISLPASAGWTLEKVLKIFSESTQSTQK